ncbi:hypothetical protein H4696_006562 [Amycolatopsis lexingtonensis]|uniref:Uncharacterized protein n=1 Tax=Amycolatopsis lexingtonensis TaxID=218822 RepID=A0ABR9I908_9PSEU|nr:hypothetical protein [Amycolatopsis lexingtonensis]MBE1499462.1 hypothetical protein [Amycolatopsis lexingtonensis]
MEWPRPGLHHQSAAARLTYLVDEWLTDGCSMLSGVELVPSEAPLTVRVPEAGIE